MLLQIDLKADCGNFHNSFIDKNLKKELSDKYYNKSNISTIVNVLKKFYNTTEVVVNQTKFDNGSFHEEFTCSIVDKRK